MFVMPWKVVETPPFDVDELISGLVVLRPYDDYWVNAVEELVQAGFEHGMKAYARRSQPIPEDMGNVRDYGDVPYWNHFKLIVEDALIMDNKISEDEEKRGWGDPYSPDDVRALASAMMAGHVMAIDYQRSEREKIDGDVPPISFAEYRDNVQKEKGIELVDIPF